MSNVKFYSQNYITERATDLIASSTDPFFPVNNLKLDMTTKVWRTVNGVSTGSIVVDVKTVEDINSCLVLVNKLTGVGFNGSLTLEANATNVWTSPAFTTTVTLDTKYNMGLSTFATQNYRWWKITGTGTGYLELSKIFLGEYIQLTSRNIDFGWSYTNKSLDEIEKNKYGQKFIDIYGTQSEINATIKYLNKTDVGTMMDMFDFNGLNIPFYLVMDEDELFSDSKYRFAGYFYFTKKPTIVNNYFGLYELSIGLEEAI